MKTEKILDSTLIAFLDKYSDMQDSVGTNLMNSIKKAKDAEVIIPVLGMQGMGKSTLINGLLKENILPNDADETTCVPVEVKYGTNECAKVHFFDNSKIVTVHTREELNEFVDNNYNPANEKHVANIELFRNIDLLKNGMTIVDLPGVGSLTKENENTTKRYVENLCSAIFVIPTVPTIRKMESLFIKSLWAQFSKAIFVQNNWGETEKELEESKDFNNKVLRNIAEELHNPYDNDIIVVNAYNAISGYVQKNQELVDDSNIQSLYDKIISLSSNWEDEKDNFLLSRLSLSVEYARSIILKRLSDFEKSKEEIDRENYRKINEFREGTREISDKIDALKRFIRDKGDDVYFFARNKANECVKKIRAALYKVIDYGVYDGEYLSKAFSDIQDDHTKDFMDEILAFFMEIKFEVESKFDDIQQIELDNQFNLHAETFESESAFKWEKGAQLGLNIGGAVVGATGAAGATAAIYAALGIATATGPAGWVVAGVGLAIYGLFSLAGWGIKKVTQANRAGNAKKAVDPHIDEIEKQLIKAITEKYSDFATSCNNILDDKLSSRAEEERLFVKSLNEPVDKSQENSLRKDLNYINEKRKEFTNV